MSIAVRLRVFIWNSNVWMLGVFNTPFPCVLAQMALCFSGPSVLLLVPDANNSGKCSCLACWLPALYRAACCLVLWDHRDTKGTQSCSQSILTHGSVSRMIDMDTTLCLSPSPQAAGV